MNQFEFSVLNMAMAKKEEEQKKLAETMKLINQASNPLSEEDMVKNIVSNSMKDAITQGALPQAVQQQSTPEIVPQNQQSPMVAPEAGISPEAPSADTSALSSLFTPQAAASVEANPNPTIGNGLGRFMSSFGHGVVDAPVQRFYDAEGNLTSLDKATRIGSPDIWDYTAHLMGRAFADEALPKTKSGSSLAEFTRQQQSSQMKQEQMALRAANTAATTTSSEDIAATGEGILSGNIPPDISKTVSFRDRTKVSAYLSKKGFNLSKLSNDYFAVQKSLSALNSPQQTRLRQSLDQVQQDIPELKNISNQFDRTNIKWPANALIVSARLNGITLNTKVLGKLQPDQVEIATKFVTQINAMRDDMAVSFSSGYAPTESSFKLADQMLNPAYGAKQLSAALDQIGVNVRIGKTAIENTTPISSSKGQNPYWDRYEASPQETQKLSNDEAWQKFQDLKKKKGGK